MTFLSIRIRTFLLMGGEHLVACEWRENGVSINYTLLLRYQYQPNTQN